MQNPFAIPLQRLAATIQRIKPDLVNAIGNEALIFVRQNFNLQGYQGRTFIPWPIQQKPDKPRPHKILILDRFLIDSFKKQENEDSVTISTDIPYARVHNEGSNGIVYRPSRMGTFGPGFHHRIIPQRQFMPITADDAPVLTQKCHAVIIRKITDALPK